MEWQWFKNIIEKVGITFNFNKENSPSHKINSKVEIKNTAKEVKNQIGQINVYQGLNYSEKKDIVKNEHEIKYVDFNYPADSGLKAQYESDGYKIRWCRADNLSRCLDIEGWQYAFQHLEDGMSYILKIKEPNNELTLIAKKDEIGGSKENKESSKKINIENGGIGTIIKNTGDGTAEEIIHKGIGNAQEIKVTNSGIGEIVINTGKGTAKKITKYAEDSALDVTAECTKNAHNADIIGAIGMAAIYPCKNCNKTLTATKAVLGLVGKEPEIEVACTYCGHKNVL